MQPSQILHAIRRNLVACLVILLVCILAGLGVALSTSSEARRVGKEWPPSGSSRGAPYH